MDILHKKTTVCTVLKEVKKAKATGKLDLKSLYLYNIVASNIATLKCLKKNEHLRHLEGLLIKIKYSSNVSDNKIKDLKSFKGIVTCKDCNKLFGQIDSLDENTGIIPYVENNVYNVENTYIFKESDFTTNFESYNNGGPNSVIILNLPEYGIIKYNNIIIEENFQFELVNVSLLTYEVSVDLDYDFSFNFKTSNNINIFSNMASFTFNVSGYVNQPPNSVGNRTVTVDNSSIYILTEADFTTATTPAYSDPEGDEVANVKIIELPLSGELQLIGVTVTLNQIIPFTDVQSGNLTYVADTDNVDSHSTSFNFELSDTGSNTFIG